MAGSSTGHQKIKLLPSGDGEAPGVEHRRRLLELADVIDTPHAFRKGQLVRWKAGLRNRQAPVYNEVAVVREVLAAPVFDDCEQGRCAGSPYFREPLTVVLAILDPDGDFVEFHFDGRRFEPVES